MLDFSLVTAKSFSLVFAPSGNACPTASETELQNRNKPTKGTLKPYGPGAPPSNAAVLPLAWALIGLRRTDEEAEADNPLRDAAGVPSGSGGGKCDVEDVVRLRREADRFRGISQPCFSTPKTFSDQHKFTLSITHISIG
eukprot:gb/GECG01006749.1/.p1 GENE.gb/GECG01006749.1/~~gb/GECG01006749.1/.p1  ORF type:complete len:140 (+),score=9.90 gb/GECG01006749.1/:1-420(+)